MFIQRISPACFPKKYNSVMFRSTETQTSQTKQVTRDDSYYTARAELYMDMYYQCGGAGCDDEETVAYYQEKMTEIENEFKAANRRIRDCIPKKQDNDDI